MARVRPSFSTSINPLKLLILLAISFVTLFSLFSIFFNEMNPAMRLLATVFILTGIPHGALDIFLMRKILNSSKKKLFWGLLLYLTLSVVIVLVWPLLPTLCFVFFLFYSLFHFADSDMQSSSLTTGEWWVEFLARFALPFSLSFIFHRAETSQLVSWVHPEIRLSQLAPLLYFLGIFSLTFVVINSYINFKKFFKTGKPVEVGRFEPILIAAIFITIPPLYAFALYFCLIHSLRHIFNVFNRIEIGDMRTILPYWLAPLLGLPVIFYFSASNPNALDQKIFQYMIIVLAGLALPHFLLVRYAKKKSLLD